MQMNTIKLLAASAFMLLPLSAFAETSDVAYCHALATRYREFYVTDGGHYRDNGPIDGNIAAEQCSAGNLSGIPVLEKKLRDAKVTLPSRG